jgi:hypothetical protein
MDGSPFVILKKEEIISGYEQLLIFLCGMCLVGGPLAKAASTGMSQEQLVLGLWRWAWLFCGLLNKHKIIREVSKTC